MALLPQVLIHSNSQLTTQLQLTTPSRQQPCFDILLQQMQTETGCMFWDWTLLLLPVVAFALHRNVEQSMSSAAVRTS